MFVRLLARRAPISASISIRPKSTSIDDFFVGSKVRLRTETRKYPLTGIRVALLNRPSIGEFTARVLEDFGADVAKFCEPPDDGFKVKESHGRVIDLTTTEDVNLIRNISGNVDILIDYLHGGRLEKVGLDPEVLLKANSQLIIARITAYGQNGPLGHATGGDATIAALSGAIHELDHNNDHVLKAAKFEARALTMAGRANCVSSVLLALYERESSGRGQIIDMSVTENVSYLDKVTYETGLDIPKAFNRFYVTSDKKFIAVSILGKGQQDKFLQITGSDPNGDLEANIVGRMTQKSLAEWLDLLKGISSVVEVLDHKTVGTHKQHREREAFNYDDSTNLWVAKATPRFTPQ
uniref:NAD(P)-bd_dom domain-containing protein n=1 Tax=Panagrellus redivivus TaxID=6233 RepID=A0A7E4W2Q5_PANRE